MSRKDGLRALALIVVLLVGSLEAVVAQPVDLTQVRPPGSAGDTRRTRLRAPGVWSLLAWVAASLVHRRPPTTRRPEQNKGFLAAILGGLLGSILFFFAILSYMVLHRFYDNAHKETRAVQ